jgi:hypothetical protein
MVVANMVLALADGDRSRYGHVCGHVDFCRWRELMVNRAISAVCRWIGLWQSG